MVAQKDQVDGRRLIWGAAAIAAELGVPTRKAFYLLEKGLAPANKVGNQWVSTPDKLRQGVLGEPAT
jgi:hypothetical protein